MSSQPFSAPLRSCGLFYLNILINLADSITIAFGPAYIEGAVPLALLTATAILPAYVSINTSTSQAIAETKIPAKISAALARIAMYLTAFLLTQKTLASKPQIQRRQLDNINLVGFTLTG